MEQIIFRLLSFIIIIGNVNGAQVETQIMA